MFSVTCVFVCKLLPVKDFSATTCLRIKKFGTKVDMTSCSVLQRMSQTLVINQSHYLPIFLSPQQKFLSQVSQLLFETGSSNFVYTLRVAKSFVKKKIKVLIYVLILLS